MTKATKAILKGVALNVNFIKREHFNKKSLFELTSPKHDKS